MVEEVPKLRRRAAFEDSGRKILLPAAAERIGGVRQVGARVSAEVVSEGWLVRAGVARRLELREWMRVEGRPPV